MWGRQIAGSLLKRVRWGCQFGSTSFRETSHGSTTERGRTAFASQFSYKHKLDFGSAWQMLLLGQAALFAGGSISFAYAEEKSDGMVSSNNPRGSNNIDLQPVEDGSIISNEHTSKWRVFTDSGRDYFLQGKLNEAEKLFTAALSEAKMGFGERDPHVASACNNLAELYRVRKIYDKAEPLYLDSIRILEEVFGPEDVRVGAALHNLGQFYIMQRKLEEARACYERALRIKGRILGHGHPDYAETMFHLGTVLYLQGHVKDAEVLIQDSIRILEEGGQGESYSCIRKLRYLAKIYLKANNRLQEAENVQKKILQIMEATKGWNSLDTVIAAESLSLTLQSNGQLRGAQELLERCLDVRRTLLPEDHLQIGANKLGLANVALLNFVQTRTRATAQSLMELDRAKDFLKDSIRIAEKFLDVLKQKRENRANGYVGKDEHTALLILLQSLKALAQVEMAKHELQEAERPFPVPEAEKALHQCISTFKKHTAMDSNTASIELKAAYVSCMKNLLNLTAWATKNCDKSPSKEVQDLKNQISLVEAELQSIDE